MPAVASAVALAISGSSFAATVAAETVLKRVGTEKVTVEVAAVPSYAVSLPALNFVIGTDAYRAGDTVTLTVAGGTVASTASAAAGGMDFACTSDVVGVAGSGISGAMSFSFTSVSGNVLTYQVVRADASKPVYVSSSTAFRCSLATDKIYISGASIKTPSLVTVNYQPSGSGVTYDSLADRTNNWSVANGIGASPVMQSIAQYGLQTSSSRNPITNVGEPIVSTTVGAGSLTKSTLSGSGFGSGTAGSYVTFAWMPIDEAQSNSGDDNTYAGKLTSGISGVVAYTTSARAVTTISGDFNFLDDDSNGCSSTDLTLGAGTVSAGNGTVTINSTCTALTFVHSNTGARSPARIGFKLNGVSDNSSAATAGSVGSKSGKALVAQTFAATTTWSSTAADGTVTTLATADTAPGSWSAAVASTTGAMNVPYLPYGTGISRIVYYTNATAAAGTATFSARSDAGTVCSSANFGTVSVPASGVALLTTAIDAGVAACFGPTFSGKATVDVTVSGVSGGVVTSAYNVNGNRVNVINATNGK